MISNSKCWNQDTKLHQVLEQYSQHPTKYVGAICAAPIALEAANLFKGKKITSHPSVKDRLKGYVYHSDERVVVDGHLVTRYIYLSSLLWHCCGHAALFAISR